MKRVRGMCFVLILAVMLPVMAGGEPSTTDDIGAAIAAARSDEEMRAQLHIEIEGQLGDDLRRVDIFGRGIGIWNSERQFVLNDKAVTKVIDLLLRAGFPSMPARIGETQSPVAAEKPMKLVRSVTVTVGGASKIVVQDNKTPNSADFEKLVDRLLAQCHKPAQNGTGAESLDDGLGMVAAGTLYPETMTLTINAPQMRSLPSQQGQGWLMSLRFGTLTLQTHTLENGFQEILVRPASAKEAMALARSLVEAGVSNLPASINSDGYMQLSVAVLNHRHRLTARPLASPPSDDRSVESISDLRSRLHRFFEAALEQRTTAKRPVEPSDG